MSKSQEYRPALPATSRTRLVLFIVWGIQTSSLVLFVAFLGSNCPNADEWGFVPALTGNEPLGEWLWDQHNEHRLPLPRLLYYSLFQLAHDFRTACWAQVGLLSGTCLGAMIAASRLRGRPAWTDLFFPISLLHAGHWENLLIGYNLCFALILVLETAIGVLALTATRESAFRRGLLAGISMALLCLCGGGGVIAAAPVAIWLGYLAIFVGFRNGTKRSLRKAGTLLVFAAFPFAYLAIYLTGYHRPGHHPELGEGGFDVVRVTGEVMALAFGYGAARYWIVAAIALALLGSATLFRLIRTARDSERRIASVGLLSVLAGIVGVALVIGLGRAGIDARNGLASRYAYLTWPVLALTYLFWTQGGGWAGKWVPAGLCLAAALVFPLNMMSGLSHGAEIRRTLADVEEDARAGLPPEAIVRHFHEGKLRFQRDQDERAIRAIPMLREAGVASFVTQGK